MSQGQGVRLGGGEQGSHQVLFVNHPQPLLDAVWRRGGAAGRGDCEEEGQTKKLLLPLPHLFLLLSPLQSCRYLPT